MATETVIALFADLEQAESAIRSLRESRLPDEEISLVMRDPAEEPLPDETDPHRQPKPALVKQGAAIGGGIGGVGGLLASLTPLLIPGVGPTLALGALTTALGAGLGAALGGAAGALGSGEIAHVYEQRLRLGDVLVAVSTEPERVERAESVLTHAGGQHIIRWAET